MGGYWNNNRRRGGCLGAVLLLVLLTCAAARADFVLDMTMCQVKNPSKCENLSLLARRSVLVCFLGAKKIIEKIEAVNLERKYEAKWKLKTYKCRGVPNGTRIG